MNTNVSVNSCPSKEELDKFLTKTIDNPQRINFLTDHVSNCPKCQAEVASSSEVSASTTLFSLNDPKIETQVNQELSVPTQILGQNEGLRGKDTQPGSATEIFKSVHSQNYPAKIGDFIILRLLGKGGMGLVLEGEDPILKRKVAVKILHPEFGLVENNRLRFMQEARAAAAIEHENIITIYQVGEQDKTPFIAMNSF
jgi:hypothetical protein